MLRRDFCPRGSRSVGRLVQTLVLVHGILGSEEMTGRIEYA
jgi:hypothetical protein